LLQVPYMWWRQHGFRPVETTKLKNSCPMTWAAVASSGNKVRIFSSNNTGLAVLRGCWEPMVAGAHWVSDTVRWWCPPGAFGYLALGQHTVAGGLVLTSFGARPGGSWCRVAPGLRFWPRVLPLGRSPDPLRTPNMLCAEPR
jgi:hypothetical protein